MRKVLFLALFSILLLSTAWAGYLDVGISADLYTPSDSDSGATLLYGLNANYFINPTWSARGELQYATYKTRGKTHSLMPIKLSAIGHLLPGQALDPYVGAGFGYYTEMLDGAVATSNIGGQFITGVSWVFLNTSLSFELQYVLPSFSGGKGFLSYGADLHGQTGFSVPF